MIPRPPIRRSPVPGLATRTSGRGASRALPRAHAPATAWTRLKMPDGALILGRGTGTGNLNYVPAEMLSMHTLVAGSTGSGKSMFLFNCFMQHVLQLDGTVRGGTLIDPHGSLSSLVEEYVAAHDLHRVRPIRIVRPGAGQCVGYDLLPDVPGVDPGVIVDAVVGAVAAVWHQNLDEMPRLRQALSAVLYAIKACRLTLLEAVDLMTVEDRSGLRRYVTERVRHPVFRAYFEDLEALPVSKRKEEFESTGRRLSEFLKLDIIRLCFGVRSKEKMIDFGTVMDEGEILVLDLSTGPHLSLSGSKLLGSLVVNSLFLHALKRGEGALPHHLFIDEAGQYLTEDAASILDQARKFGLYFTLCVQTLAQIRERGEKLFGSVIANTRTKIIFGGLDDDDATHLARTCWRGQFSLERSKRSFERFMVTGDELVWLENEGEGQGRSRSTGETRTTSEDTADHDSSTESSSRTESESEGKSVRTSRRAQAEGEGAETRSSSASSGTTRGSSTTTGSTRSRGHSWGESWSDTESEQHTTGRSQAFRSVYEKLPTKEYSLEELVHLASVSIGNLPQGVCLAKIGSRKVVRVKALTVKRRVVSDEHLSRVRREMFAATPFALTREEAEKEYVAFRAALEQELKKRDGDDEE